MKKNDDTDLSKVEKLYSDNINSISSSFVIGIIFAFPYAFWEFWRFISPGLYVNEKKAARGATFYVSLLFFIGVMFGYFILTPISINFLANYQIDPSILNEFDIISYVSTITTLVLASVIGLKTTASDAAFPSQ